MNTQEIEMTVKFENLIRKGNIEESCYMINNHIAKMEMGEIDENHFSAFIIKICRLLQNKNFKIMLGFYQKGIRYTYDDSIRRKIADEVYKSCTGKDRVLMGTGFFKTEIKKAIRRKEDFYLFSPFFEKLVDLNKILGKKKNGFGLYMEVLVEELERDQDFSEADDMSIYFEDFFTEFGNKKEYFQQMVSLFKVMGKRIKGESNFYNFLLMLNRAYFYKYQSKSKDQPIEDLYKRSISEESITLEEIRDCYSFVSLWKKDLKSYLRIQRICLDEIKDFSCSEDFVGFNNFRKKIKTMIQKKEELNTISIYFKQKIKEKMFN